MVNMEENTKFNRQRKDYDIQKLLFERKILFQLNMKRRVGKIIRQNQTE